jgi:hypothetical protein
MMLSRSLFLVLLLFQGPYAALSHPTGEYNDEHLGIQLSRHFKQNTKNGTARIVEHDKARIAAMKGRHYAGRSDEHVAGRGTNSFGSPNDGVGGLFSSVSPDLTDVCASISRFTTWLVLELALQRLIVRVSESSTSLILTPLSSYRQLDSRYRCPQLLTDS